VRIGTLRDPIGGRRKILITLVLKVLTVERQNDRQK
jgi:hypothetical protein